MNPSIKGSCFHSDEHNWVILQEGVQQLPSQSVQWEQNTWWQWAVRIALPCLVELYLHSPKWDQPCSPTQTLTQTTRPQISHSKNWLHLLQTRTSLCLILFVLATYRELHDQRQVLLVTPSPTQWHFTDMWALLMCSEVQAWSDGNTAKCKEILNSALTVFVLPGTVKLYLTSFTYWVTHAQSCFILC